MFLVGRGGNGVYTTDAYDTYLGTACHPSTRNCYFAIPTGMICEIPQICSTVDFVESVEWNTKIVKKREVASHGARLSITAFLFWWTKPFVETC